MSFVPTSNNLVKCLIWKSYGTCVYCFLGTVLQQSISPKFTNLPFDLLHSYVLLFCGFRQFPSQDVGLPQHLDGKMKSVYMLTLARKHACDIGLLDPRAERYIKHLPLILAAGWACSNCIFCVTCYGKTALTLCTSISNTEKCVHINIYS